MCSSRYESGRSLKEICIQSPIPVVADIHFDYKLALKAIENGVSFRINLKYWE